MTRDVRQLFRKLLLWGLVSLLGTAAVACSTPNRVDPADAAQVRSIDATVERLRQAYVTKDAQTFHSLLMPLDSLHRLELEVERDFAIYDRIQLDVAIDRVLIEGTDVADILNSLCDIGYVEVFPPVEPINYLNYAESRFEINPSYALQLKEAMKRY